MNLFEPSSPTILERKQKRDEISVKAKASRAEMIRLGKELFPEQWHTETVKRAAYVAPHNSPPLGVMPYTTDTSVTHTGASEHDDSDLIRRTLAGEIIKASAGTQETFEAAQRQLAAYEVTIEHLSREIERESNILRDEYAKALEPKHRDLMVKLSKAVIDVHAAYSEVHGLKCHLIDSAVNLRRGLCNTLPEFLGNPNDSFGDMSAFLTAAKMAGYIREVPQSLRMKVSK